MILGYHQETGRAETGTMTNLAVQVPDYPANTYGLQMAEDGTTVDDDEVAMLNRFPGLGIMAHATA